MTIEEGQNPNALLTLLVSRIISDNHDDVVKIAHSLERLRKENFLYRWGITLGPSGKAQNPLSYKVNVERWPKKE